MNKRTIERYLNKKGYTHDMPLQKHELTQKQKKDWLKFWKEYIDHEFSQTVFIDETLFRVGKAKQKMENIGEKYGISFNKHKKGKYLGRYK